MRKLATIQQISNIITIPEADRICAYQINGWKVVDTINRYQVGEKVVYIEPDSFVPHEIAPFLSGNNEPSTFEGIRGERLKTKRLRGVYSQGLILPNTFGDLPIDTDITEHLGIVKWERPETAQISGFAKGNFPSICPKTDEPRIQNMTREWDTYVSLTFEVTEKVEGTSTTIGLDNGEFVVCSRNLSLKEVPNSPQWMIARKYSIEEKMKDMALDNHFIQGELIGTGIQGDYYGLKSFRFMVFNVFNATEGQYLNPDERYALVEKLGLTHVPIIDKAFSLAKHTADDLLEMADGKSAINPSKNREGLVFKQLDGPAHFKVISNKYLLKNGD